MAGEAPRTIGNRIAPARFILFVVLLFAAAPAAMVMLSDWRTGTMVGFDVAGIAFLASCMPLLQVGDPKRMSEDARRNDANRAVLLAVTAIVTLAILATIAALMAGERESPGSRPLVIATLLIAWLFSNTIYALHYAHLAYSQAGGGRENGIQFQGTTAPVYSDFVYFAFTLGMTFQTSDVAIADAGIRRVVTFHCLAAFIFNIGVLAFTINVLGK